jgi:hypothetical protein
MPPTADDGDTALWTEAKFIQFWQNVTQFIEEGKAGWGTQLYKEALGEAVWKIRLFTWAELLGHIWLTLWILSDKSTGHIAMNWISGDGSAVIKMSGGGSHQKGRLSSWTRKGPMGVGGSWGIGQSSLS